MSQRYPNVDEMCKQPCHTWRVTWSAWLLATSMKPIHPELLNSGVPLRRRRSRNRIPATWTTHQTVRICWGASTEDTLAASTNLRSRGTGSNKNTSNSIISNNDYCNNHYVSRVAYQLVGRKPADRVMRSAA